MEQCKAQCDYYGFCGGGTGSNKYWEHGTLHASETCACRFATQIPVASRPRSLSMCCWISSRPVRWRRADVHGVTRYGIAGKVQKKFKEIDQGFVGGFMIDPVIGRSTMVDPVVAVADSLQALRNGTTDDQWDLLKANPLVKDLLRKCSDLEAALLVGDGVPQDQRSARPIVFKSVVDAHLLLAA